MKPTWIISVVLMSAVVSAAADITYTDKMNRTVAIPVPVQRAVFFQTYELIPALDIWDQVVGIGRFAYKNDLMTAVKPDIEKTVPSAGSGGDVNMEALLTLSPDLVITWPYKPEFVRFIEQKGLRVIAIYPDSLAELYDVMRLHGKMFNREAKMDGTIAEMETLFSVIRERAKKTPDGKRQKALWLGGKPTSVSCGTGINNDLFQMIGAINPAGTLKQRNADVSLEQIVVWNPDVIFIWGNAGYTAQDILDNPQWRNVRAVQNRRVHKSPEWSTWSPRLAPVALWMAKQVYPEHYADIDLTKRTDEFYKRVFGIPYSKVKPIKE